MLPWRLLSLSCGKPIQPGLRTGFGISWPVTAGVSETPIPRPAGRLVVEPTAQLVRLPGVQRWVDQHGLISLGGFRYRVPIVLAATFVAAQRVAEERQSQHHKNRHPNFLNTLLSELASPGVSVSGMLGVRFWCVNTGTPAGVALG
jgi:hypothetical protein